MAVYKGKARRIKDALVTLMQAVQLNDEPAFTQVLDSAKGEFDSYPSVRVLPADQDTDKSAVGQNERTVAYYVRVHLPLESTQITEAQTIDYIYDLTELILDCLDEGDFAGSIAQIDPLIGTHILNATRGAWGFAQSPAGVLLTCDVNVSARYTKNL